MNDAKQTEKSDSQIIAEISVWAMTAECPVFEPNACLKFAPEATGAWSSSRTPGYRRILRILRGMHKGGALGRLYCYGTNQTVYWMTARMK